MEQSRPTSGVDRQILALAVPALGALVAEPLFVLVDSAVVGHLGTPQLAGLSIASTILLTVVGLCVFLAYATTAAVARRLGAGDAVAALRSGIDGMWLAAALGVGLAALLWVAAPWAVGVLGADGAVADHATSYLRWSAPGLPGMLLVLASTGVLRGLQDTRTPLWVAAGGAVANAVLNVVLVYGAGMGIAGSGLGTAVAQLAMGAILTAVVVRGARAAGAGLRPSTGGIWSSARAGAPLLVRTVSLRLAILLTVFVATGLGAVALAGHQVVTSVWGLAAFRARRPRHRGAGAHRPPARCGRRRHDPPDPATHAPVGHGRRRDPRRGRRGRRLVVRAALHVRPRRARRDRARHGCRWPAHARRRVGVRPRRRPHRRRRRSLPRGRGRRHAPRLRPVALAVRAWAPSGAAGLAWLWLAFAGVFMLARALTTGLRARGSAWLSTGT